MMKLYFLRWVAKFFLLFALLLSPGWAFAENFEKISGPVRIEGASVWLFAIPTGDSDSLVLSAEGKEGLLVGRLKLSRPEDPKDEGGLS